MAASRTRWTHEKAAALMRAAGVEPLGEFVNARTPWPCRCSTCEREVRPRLDSVRAGHGACVYCARRMDPHVASAQMHSAGFVPLEPYPGSHSPWLAQCVVCSARLKVRYANTIGRGQAGCPSCATKPGQGEVADQVMRSVGLEPLEPYPGAAAPWRSRCLNCGRESSPRYQNVRRGTTCRYCAAVGFDHTAPAVVYVAHHRAHRAVKIGIANADSRRIGQLSAAGWQIHEQLPLPTGAQASAVERAILKRWRSAGLLPCASTADILPGGGWTQTVDADAVSLERAWAEVQQTATLLTNREATRR